MRYIIRKSVGVLLILLIVLSTFTGCAGLGYTNGDNVSVGEFKKYFYAKVESDKWFLSKEDATLEFYYALYPINGNGTLEFQKTAHSYIYFDSEEDDEKHYLESVFAIYISKNEELLFERDEHGYLLDYENKVNAKLWKFVSYEDAFNTNYGYTSSGLRINYNHSEKITIPAEYFGLSNEHIYIHIARFWHDVEEDVYYIYPTYPEKPTVIIEYRLIGDTVMLI